MKASALRPFEELRPYQTFQNSKRLSTAESQKAYLKRQTSLLNLSIITQFFPPDYAATGQLIEELVKHLGQQDIDIKVFSGQPGYAFSNAVAPRYEQSGNTQIVRSRTTNLWGKRLRGKTLSGVLFTLRAFIHLVRNCRRRDLALVTTAPPFLPVLGYIVSLLFGMPYVCLLYDLYPDIAIELGVVSHQHWIAKAWRALNRRVWMRAQSIIVLSPNMKQRIVNLCPEVVDKIHVIHSWADPQKISPVDKVDNWFAHKHGLVDTFTVLYSGNMGRCHDIETIFNAAVELKDEPIRFVCIGGGAKRKELQQKIKQKGLNNFLFLPYQDKAQLKYSLTACDLSLVSVSPGMESLVAPSKLYSALASGRPVAAICPPQTYLKGMLEENSCGAWFDNGDSVGLANFIRHLSRDSEKATAMGSSARFSLEEKYTPKAIAQRYADVLCT